MIARGHSYLLPTAVVAYVTLAVLTTHTGTSRVLLLGIPLALALVWRAMERRFQSGRLLGSEPAARSVLFGTALFCASVSGPSGSAGLATATSLALLFATTGALLQLARVSPPIGLLQGHPAAQSRDAMFVALVIWSLIGSAALISALFPQFVDLDPAAFDTALLFAVLGSLLLLSAAELRVLLLRGLELGVADRARASLSFALAGTLIAVGAAWVDVAPADHVGASSLICTCLGITLTKLEPNAARVTRLVRALLALLLLGAPVALLGARAATTWSTHPALVALVISAASLVVGLIARSLSAPLGPEGSRWLGASEQAMDAALHPEPEVALREALRALRAAEPNSTARPELLRVEPQAMLSVDVAGYLAVQDAEFPDGVLALARAEPEMTLRQETVQKAQVRDPRVRPIVAWFESWGAKTATALFDDEGGVGLLVLPAGRRRSSLSLEEAQALGRLGRRMTGLLSVNSALARSRRRELDIRDAAEQALQETALLRSQIASSDRLLADETDVLTEVLAVAAHSPRARICLQEIETASRSERVEFLTPAGVDPQPWAAYLHQQAALQPAVRPGLGAHGPLVFFDGTQKGARLPATYADPPGSAPSPVARAQGGTLVLLNLGALPADAQEALAESLSVAQLRVVGCRDPSVALVPSLARVLRGPVVALPGLAERAEDLNALIVFELSRMGMAQRGKPLGLAKGAYFLLYDRPFPGNEEELRGLLRAGAVRARGDVIEAEDLSLGSEPTDEPGDPVGIEPSRSRSRFPPRSRRP